VSVGDEQGWMLNEWAMARMGNDPRGSRTLPASS